MSEAPKPGVSRALTFIMSVGVLAALGAGFAMFQFVESTARGDVQKLLRLFPKEEPVSVSWVDLADKNRSRELRLDGDAIEAVCSQYDLQAGPVVESAFVISGKNRPLVVLEGNRCVHEMSKKMQELAERGEATKQLHQKVRIYHVKTAAFYPDVLILYHEVFVGADSDRLKKVADMRWADIEASIASDARIAKLSPLLMKATLRSVEWPAARFGCVKAFARDDRKNPRDGGTFYFQFHSEEEASRAISDAEFRKEMSDLSERAQIRFKDRIEIPLN